MRSPDVPVPQKTPLRIVILTDLGSSRPAEGAFELKDPGDFQSLLEHHAPSLVLDLPNHVLDEQAPLEVRLTVRRLKDLAPSSLVAGVPLLEQLHRLVRQLQEIERGQRPVATLGKVLEDHADLARSLRISPEEVVGRDDGETVREETTTTAADPGSDSAASVDRILQLVDLPPPEERATKAIGGVISSVARGRRPTAGPSTTELGAAIEAATGRLCRQLDAIYAHPDLERLEAAWRGLKFLVDRTNFREGIRLEVVHLPRRELGDAFHATVTEPALSRSDEPVSLILAAYSFFDASVDAELIQRLGEEAELLQAPLVLSLGPSFLDLPTGSAGQLRFPSSLLDRPGLVKWVSLRGKPSSRWLAAVFNGFLLAEPRIDGSSVGLPDLGPRHLWGDPTFAVASLVTRSFAETGWPTEISGSKKGRVRDLPLGALQLEPGRSIGLPVEHLIPQQTVEDLSRAGVVTLFARPDSDEAVVLWAPTLFQEQIANQPTTRGRQISLGYQLMAGRIAQALSGFMPDLAGLGSAEIQEELERFVRELIADTGPGAVVEVEARPAPREGRYLVSLKAKTGGAVMRGAQLELEFAI